jgi:hypothetical protein
VRRAAVLIAVVPLALAACGSGSSSSVTKLTPSAYLMQAATKSAKAQSEHLEMKGAVAVQGQEVDMTGSGDFDNAAHRGQMHANAMVTGINVEIDEVLTGTTIYMKSPLLAAALPAGKTWVKVDLEKIGKSQGIDFNQLLAQTPSQSFSQLKAAGSVTEVGDETVGGVATTHYRAKIDLSKIPQGGKIQALTNVKYGPYDVWIGKDDGYVRRTKTSYSYSAPGVGRQSATMTMNFSDFGKDVTVDVPDPSTTVDSTDQTITGLGG